MTPDQWLVLSIAIAAMVAFALERIPTELISLMVLCALALTGVLDAKAALSGFSSDAVVAVGAMFVLSAALEASGALRLLPELFARVASSRNMFRASLMPVTGVLSAFVNNTAVVAVLIPTVIRITRDRGWSPQRFLIPLSYSAQFGGVCTLIGTSTNLLVNSMAIDAGLPGFGMFDFAGLGIVLLLVGSAYLMLFSRLLLPEREGAAPEQLFELDDFVTELEVVGDALIGRSVESLKLPSRMGLTPIDLIRDGTRYWLPENVQLQAGDVIRVSGAVRTLSEIDPRSGLRLHPVAKADLGVGEGGERRLLQVMVPDRSGAIEHTPGEIGLSERYNAALLALRRHGTPVFRQLENVHFQVGDVALLMSTPRGAELLQASRDFVVLREDRHAPLRIRSLLVPVGIVAAVVASAALGWLPIYLAALLGCIAMVLTRTLTSVQAFEAVQWRVLFLIAGMLPLGLAMEQTGLAAKAVSVFLDTTGTASPLVVLSLLYLATAILTEFLSNNAAAVLLVPVGLSLAGHFGVEPTPFLVAIAFAASSSFSTPVGYQTNTMVYGAGGYRFMDFIRAGLPLNVLFWIVASFAIPYFFPFSALPAP